MKPRHTEPSLAQPRGALTAATKQDAAPGALDDSLELLLPLMEGDLFGDIADAKEAAAFAASYRGEGIA